MRGSGQALLGVLAAIVSALIVFGSLALSMAEGNVSVAFLPSATSTSTQPVPTQRPGEATYTPSPTPLATATPTMITPSGICQTPPGWIQITVEIGDDWVSLAQKYATTPDALIAGNCTDVLMPGVVIWVPPLPPTATQTNTPLPSATLYIPPKPTKPVICYRPIGWVDYIVRPGDTLSKIGVAHGISYRILMARNCLSSTLIHPGQRLWVPYVPPPTAYVPPTPVFIPTTTTPASTNTPVPPTSTRIPPSSTPVTPPSSTEPVPTATNTTVPSNTPPPPNTASPTPIPTKQEPTISAPPSPANTQPPIPLSTFTSLPSPMIQPSSTPIPKRTLSPTSTGEGSG